MGEKTGWTYIEISAQHADSLNAGIKKSFRIKGSIDAVAVKQLALIPMGDGTFILPFNATLRKNLGKKKGDFVKVEISADHSEFEFNTDFMVCLEDDPKAKQAFDQLPGSHQKYYSKWIDSAKTIPTRTNRIIRAVNALAKGISFPEMLRQKDSM